MSLLRRIGSHALAIAVVAIALVGASFSRPAVAVQVTDPELSTAAASDTPSPTEVMLAQAVLPSQVVAAATDAPQDAEQVQATVRKFDPRTGLPQWLHAVRDLPLWSSADGSATSQVSVPAGISYVKPLGPFGDSRIEVYYPGDANHPAAQAWVDTAYV